VLVSIVDVGALSAFVLLHASVVGYFVWHKKSPASAWHVAVPMVGALITAWVIAEATWPAKATAAIWLATGLAVVGVSSRQPRRP
jgi:hypothetical protein